jgi:hypothetical protein
MKSQLILIVALLAVLVQGCVVKSLHPFYLEEDVVFKAELLDAWEDQERRKWKISSVKEKPNAYEMKVSKDGKEAVFLVHLFKLDKALYLDFLPVSSSEETIDIFNMHLLPTHSVAKIARMENDEVLIKWFNEELMTELFEHNRVKIAHEALRDDASKEEDDKTYVLTASTEELQKFLIKFGGDEKAFEGDNVMKLELKRPI